jgi:predicted nucleic acid-binding protein
MTRVFWDTNLFVYYLEGGPFTQRVEQLLDRMTERGDTLLTSALTLGELLVLPHATGVEQTESAEAALRAIATIVPFDAAASRHYAAIRQNRAIKAPDAVQLACAAAAGADLFITNDERLSAQVIAGVKFITSLDRAFL